MRTPLRFPRSLSARAASAAAALLLAAGCGDGTGKTYPVEGKALADGKPLAKGSVRFKPDPGKGNTGKVEPAGEIGADGTYRLFTQGKSGAPAGWYKVSVTSTEPVDSTKPTQVTSHVGKKFNDPDASGLSVEVVPSPAAGAYDLKVSAK